MEIILKVDGMHCEGCKKTLELELSSYSDIESVKVSLEEKFVMIKTKDNIKIKDLEKRIKKAGFKSMGPITNGEEYAKDNS